MIHFNVAYPLIGRLIGGLGDSFPSVASGELIRLYDEEGSTWALWWLASVYSFGSLIGPVMVLFFKDVNFYISSVHVTQLNVIGIFMAALLVMAIVCAHFLVYDCSAQIDMKEYIKRNHSNQQEDTKPSMEYQAPTENTQLLPPDDNDSDSDKFTTIPMITVLQNLSQSKDTILLFVSTFVFMYGLFAAEILLPLLVYDVLEWSLETLTWLMVCYSILYFLLLMFMSKFCTSARSIYAMAIVCIVFNIIMFLSMTGMKMFERVIARDVFLMTCFIVAFVFAWIIEEVCCSVITH